MKVVCIVQARMGSTRLPGKVLKQICGKTVLEHDINRIRKSNLIEEIIVATTIKDEDMRIVDECKRLGVKCFRGSEDDVLARYYYAAKEAKADVVVRITSDCPLIDYEITDNTIKELIDNKEKFDYVSNTLEPTFPRGLDTEAFKFNVLAEAYFKSTLKRDREHVTPYIYMNPDIFKLGCYKGVKDNSNLRWTLDTEEDYKFVTEIYNRLYKINKDFTMNDVLHLLDKEKQLLEINNKIIQKTI